jgi:predicted deacylase
VHTVQTVMNQLDPAEMSGTVMAVTDVSRPAMEGMQRRWPNSGRGVKQARPMYAALAPNRFKDFWRE